MKNEREQSPYEAPELTALLLAVEAGFALSPVKPGTPGGTGTGVEEDDEDDL